MSSSLESYVPNEDFGLTDGTDEGGNLFSSVNYEGVSALSQSSQQQDLVRKDNEGNDYLSIPPIKIAGLDAAFALPKDTIKSTGDTDTDEAPTNDWQSPVRALTGGRQLEREDWQPPAQVQEAPAELSRFLPSAEQVMGAVQAVVKPFAEVSNAVVNVGSSVRDALTPNPSSAEQPRNVEQTPEVKQASMGVAALPLAAAPLLAPAGTFSLNTLGTVAAAAGEVLVVPAAGIAAFWVTEKFINPAIGNLTPEQIESRDSKIRSDARDEMKRLYPEGLAKLEAQERGESVSIGVNGSQIIKAARTAALQSVSSAESSLRTGEYMDAGRVISEGVLDSLATATDRSNVVSFRPANPQSESEVTNSNESQNTKPDKNGKKPEDDGERPSIVDTRFGNNKRQADFGKVLGASVGIGGDIGDVKPLPIGVDPKERILPGDRPDEGTKIGDKPPEKVILPSSPVIPPDQRDVITNIRNQFAEFMKPSSDGLRLVTSDRPPTDFGDSKQNSQFIWNEKPAQRPAGDPAADRPVVPIDDILKGAGGVRSSNDFDERLRYLTNGVGYDEAKLADAIRKHPMFPFIYEGLSDAEKSELERLDVKKPVLDKYSPRFDVSMSSNSDILASTAGDADPLTIGKAYFDADSYEVKSTWLGFGPKEYHYFREGEQVGKLSQRELDELSQENRTSDLDQSEGSSERNVVSIPSDSKPIGRGGQADVYKAPGGEEIYKVFREPGEKAERSALQEQESSIVLDRLGVSHARVKEIAVTDDGRTVIVEEYVPGKTVKDWSVSARNKPSDSEKERVMEQYEDAYRKLADNGYYVKDPNLGNAILTPDGTLVLIDVNLGQSDTAAEEASTRLEGIRRQIFE